ncbi:MAG: class I SAM-dependent methyltransferase [Candidatus Omnitrophica bacterium]|nr:class I SAM-dependent methyltransferase [Candidatus Omnitrophota bacterium]
MKQRELEQKTRKIFHKIHAAQGDEPEIFDRLTSLLSCKYLKEKKDFFYNKICLDVGCGSNANATLSMLRMGAKKVYAVDLDKSILETAPRLLSGFEGRYVLDVGNVLDLDYEGDFFDFVLCAGVLHHTADALRGMKELARVTKKGGCLYITIQGKGGLMKEITNLLRDKYAKDTQFKELIDGLDKSHFLELWRWLNGIMREHDDTMAANIPESCIKELFNKDLVYTIQDRITAPRYDEFTESEIVDWLRDNSFIKITRLTRYPSIKNIRRFLCPFYYKYDHRFSRILYGDGHIQIKATKVR